MSEKPYKKSRFQKICLFTLLKPTYKKWHIHGIKAHLYVNFAGSLQFQKYTFTHKHIPNPNKCPAHHFWLIFREVKQPHTILQAYKRTTFNWSCQAFHRLSPNITRVHSGNKSSQCASPLTLKVRGSNCVKESHMNGQKLQQCKHWLGRFFGQYWPCNCSVHRGIFSKNSLRQFTDWVYSNEQH